jgi:DNA polymerase III delta subunit
MITIIHGDDLSSSRNYFLELRHPPAGGQKEIISFDGEKITLTDLVQNIEGSGLFGSTKTIFIENLLTKLKKTDKTTKEILNFIAKHSKNSTFVFWESKEISKRDLFAFKNAMVKMFKLPKNIFLFLDNLKPGNSKNLLNLFHQAIESGIKEELILFMMQRQIRILLALSDPSEKESIEEIARLAPWQMNKLVSQTKLFQGSTLKNIYKKLYGIEIGQKTGGLPLTLIQTIDFFLLEI